MNFTKYISEDDNNSCCDYYPNVYMEINHKKEWNDYEKSLNE